MKRHHLVGLAGIIILFCEVIDITRYLPTAREVVEVMGAYLFLAGSLALLVGVFFLNTSSRYKFWIFTSLAIPGGFFLMIAGEAARRGTIINCLTGFCPESSITRASPSVVTSSQVRTRADRSSTEERTQAGAERACPGEFARWCLPELTVEHREQLLLVYLDGEVTHLRSPLRYRNRARDLRVIVPSTSEDRNMPRYLQSGTKCDVVA